jgi:hypothetical protein
MTNVIDRTTASDSLAGTALQEVSPEQMTTYESMVPTKGVTRFKLIDPNQAWFIWLQLLIFVAILAASIVWSFNAIVEMSVWMAPNEHLRWLPAVFLDMAIIGYSFSLATFSGRGEIGMRKLWATRMGLIISTGFSMVANGTHTIDFWDDNITTYQAIIGVIFSAAIPLIALMTTEEIVRLAFLNPDEVSGRLPSRKVMPWNWGPDKYATVPTPAPVSKKAGVRR